MAEYTPTTDEVRECYAAGHPVGIHEAASDFMRWYAEEIRKAKHEAFEEGVLQADIDIILERETYTNPYDKED